jgi:YbgC/YbaW family acyl-CoA thioester hydrolase
MRDVDAFGVVWYGNYLVLCDEARAELLRAYGMPPGRFTEWGYGAAVVEVVARYFSPARHDDEVDVHVRIPKANGAKLEFEFTIRRTDGNDLIARLTTTMVLLRANGDLVFLVPEQLRDNFARMLAGQPAEAP